MSYQTVDLKKEGRLAYLRLNRPTKMNAMDDVMMRELADVLESLHQDTVVQVVIISGEGAVFSAGGDIKMMMNPTQPLNIEDVMGDIGRLATAIYTLPQISIAAVHGAVAGLGFSFALGCDHIITEAESKIAMNFIGIGLVPDGAGHFFLKERIGNPEAKKLIWSGQVMSGIEAMEKGLADDVVPSGKVMGAAETYAHQLLASPIAAMMATKKILHEQNRAQLENVLKMESEAQIAMRKTADHVEGIQAFVEKRKPRFNGQ